MERARVGGGHRGAGSRRRAGRRGQAGPPAPATSAPDGAIAPASGFRRVGANLGSTPLVGAPTVPAASARPFRTPAPTCDLHRAWAHGDAGGGCAVPLAVPAPHHPHARRSGALAGTSGRLEPGCPEPGCCEPEYRGPDDGVRGQRDAGRPGRMDRHADGRRRARATALGRGATPRGHGEPSRGGTDGGDLPGHGGLGSRAAGPGPDPGERRDRVAVQCEAAFVYPNGLG